MNQIIKNLFIKMLENSGEINREVFLSLLEKNPSAKLVDFGGGRWCVYYEVFR